MRGDEGLNDPYAIAAGDRQAGIAYATHANPWELRFVEPGSSPETVRSLDDRLSNGLALAISHDGAVIAIEHRGVLFSLARHAGAWSERTIATSERSPTLQALCPHNASSDCANPTATRYAFGDVTPWSSKVLLVSVKYRDSFSRGVLSGSNGGSFDVVQRDKTEATAFVIGAHDGPMTEVQVTAAAGEMSVSAVSGSDGTVHVVAYERQRANDTITVRYFALSCRP